MFYFKKRGKAQKGFNKYSQCVSANQSIYQFYGQRLLDNSFVVFINNSTRRHQLYSLFCIYAFLYLQ